MSRVDLALSFFMTNKQVSLLPDTNAILGRHLQAHHQPTNSVLMTVSP
jgi:hypothetical protein